MLRTDMLLLNEEARADSAGGTTPDQRAWASLAASVARLVRARVAPRDVDDLVQEVLLRATTATRRQPALSPALVRGIARHVVADYHRRRAREHHRLARLAGEPDDPGGEPLTRVESDVASALSFFLAGISPVHRAAVQAVDVEGRAQASVARELGVPLSTLRTRVQRGRAELRALLRRACDIEVDARGHVLRCEPRTLACACVDAAGLAP